MVNCSLCGKIVDRDCKCLKAAPNSIFVKTIRGGVYPYANDDIQNLKELADGPVISDMYAGSIKRILRGIAQFEREQSG